MERFCNDLRDHAMKIINYEEKEMTLPTDKVNLRRAKGFFHMQKRIKY